MRFPDRIECRLAWMPAQGGHDELKAALDVQKVRKALGQTGCMNASEMTQPVHRWRSNMRELPHADECGFMEELIMKGGRFATE